MLDLCPRFLYPAAALIALGCSSGAERRSAIGGCIAQATGSYDFVVLVRRDDGTLWVAANTTRFSRIDGPNGPLSATDSAASGSSAYGNAIGCGVVSGSVWCFPLAGPLLDATDLGAGLDFLPSASAQQVVTSLGEPRAALGDALQLAGSMNGGGASFCAVTGDGKIWCWGYDSNGFLGNGDSQGASYARPVLSDAQTQFDGALEVRIGFSSTCARRSDGSVWCWGDNRYAQLGNLPASENEQSAYPVHVSLPSRARRLTANPGDTQCAILEDTRVVCWGRNEYAQAGAPSDQPSVTPTVVTSSAGAAFTGASDLAPDRGMKATCANTAVDGLWCWGDVIAGDDAGSPYPVLAVTPASGRISAPLAAYGARDGKLEYVDARGSLVFGAGSPPSSRQPPCDE